MNEYCTLVTSDVSLSYADTRFTEKGFRGGPYDGNESALHVLCKAGWNVLECSLVPRLTMKSDDVQFAFVLERELPQLTTTTGA